MAGASLASTAVQAQVIGDSPQALDLVDNSAFFGDSLGEGNSGATFADRFTFTVDDALGVNVDAIVGSVSRSADVGLDITGLWIYNGNDTLISTGTSLQTGAVDVWTVAGDSLVAGDYYLRVDGNVVSGEGASFGGAVMLAPVPEPETYGMMLGGLGVLGFLARRRQSRRG
ncbi:FxDxF family PEP-CTERM protein [Massilia sp.]|uniref:FxDxF family PEP-CTERM protein n=1 Tax=Massilia sp. TaxID=1882437 RepID=UPI0028ADA8CC|nr:FxDxF family PEP-CTERM protein [Massilia sp.]